MGEKGFAPSVLGHLSKKEGTSLASTQDAGERGSWLADICVAQGDVAGTVEHAGLPPSSNPLNTGYSQENPALADRKRIDPLGKG